MTTGKQLAGLLLLTTALTFPQIVAAQDTAQPVETETQDDVEEAAQAAADPQPGEEEQQEEVDISVPGGPVIVVTGRSVRDVERSSTQVVSVLSTEDIARTGEGDIAGALGRVTGLSVQGNGFVFVRGLGDRYSLALLNGLPLPSPQPLSRVVPLDIFPTNIVASSLVQKTYSANFPGEFGGGVINLTTRAVPEESFLKLSFGVSGDTLTTFSNGLDFGGGEIDFLGFDDGTRDVPPTLQNFFDSGLRLDDPAIDQQAILRQLGNPNLVLAQRIPDLPANFSYGITAGTSIDVGDNVLGIIATASLSNKWRNRSIRSQTALDADLNLDSDFTSFATDNRILVNGLLGFGFEFGDHRLRWTNLYIRDTLKQTVLSEGTDFTDEDEEQRQRTGWFERQLIDTQLVGEFEFGDLSIDARVGYAQTDREAPYEYGFTYVRTNEADQLGSLFINQLDGQRGEATVTFSDLTEELVYAGLDISYPIADFLTATAGYAYTDTARDSSRRAFLIRAPSDFDPGVGALRPDLLLGDAVIDFYNIGLRDSEPVPVIEAGLEIHAGYLQTRIEPLFGLTVDLGVRYEDAVQFANPVPVFENQAILGASTLLENDYWLPAGTITYEISDDIQARISASKTIARPQFRELLFQTYYDPESNRQFNGNPSLIDSELTNFEGRLEYYLGRGQKLSIAGFYKDLKNPIEAFSSFSDNEQITGFANAPQAELYGAEFELNYGFSLTDWGGWFETKQLLAVANYTYTKSEIKVGANDTTTVFPFGPRAASDFFRDGVPLTGQSDHIFNVQLGLEDEDILEQFTVLVNYASERVTSRGPADRPDIVEDPGLTVDFVARRELPLFGQPFELKFEARNIFGRDNFEFQSNGTNRIEINSYEVGRSFSFSVSTEF